MPNHITNIIKASAAVILALRGEKEAVDFNSVIPMPESLKNITCNGDEKLVSLLNGTMDLIPPAGRSLGDMVKQLELSNVISLIQRGGISKFDDARFENFITMLRNFRQCGKVSWDDFGTDKWGTKWNAYDIFLIDESTIQFDTAWSAPHPVIEALSAKFPDICIEHLWADEDIGSNLGHRSYFNGVSDLPIADKVEFALTLTGSDRECYRKNAESGLWEYFDKDESE